MRDRHAPQTEETLLAFGEQEYYVRPLGAARYEVAVFYGGPIPTGVYEVRGLTCTCPAGGGDRGHKHVELVRLFQRMGEPSCFAFWRDGEGLWHGRSWHHNEHTVDDTGHRLRAAHLRYSNGRR
jgi:hypothetical protein